MKQPSQRVLNLVGETLAALAVIFGFTMLIVDVQSGAAHPRHAANPATPVAPLAFTLE